MSRAPIEPHATGETSRLVPYRGFLTDLHPQGTDNYRRLEQRTLPGDHFSHHGIGKELLYDLKEMMLPRTVDYGWRAT